MTATRFIAVTEGGDRIEVVAFPDHCRISVFPLGHDMALDAGMTIADARTLGEFLINAYPKETEDNGC